MTNRKYSFKNRFERKKCKICEEPSKGLGYCSKHYQNFKRLGTPHATRKYRNSIEDLIEIVENLSENENGCKIWINSKNNYGYGTFYICDKNYLISRLIYSHYFPANYDGLVIRHKCDIRNCCNIAHLETGTTKQNSEDMVKRGRSLFGSKNYNSKLSDQQIIEIRKSYPENSITELGKKYGVTKQAISNYINYRSYSHL